MKDQLTPTPPGIPPAFVEAAKEAGESLEGWLEYQDHEALDVHYYRETPSGVQVAIGDDGSVSIFDVNIWRVIVAYNLPLPAAIRLANRLVRALEDEPEVSGELEQLREAHASLKAAIPCLFWDEEEFVDSDGDRTPESSREELLVEQFEEFVAAEGWWHVQNKLAVQADFPAPAPPTETGETEGE